MTRYGFFDPSGHRDYSNVSVAIYGPTDDETSSGNSVHQNPLPPSLRPTGEGAIVVNVSNDDLNVLAFVTADPLLSDGLKAIDALSGYFGAKFATSSVEVESSIVEETASTKVWQVGDDVNALTSKGNYPSWSTAKSRYWKNIADSAEEGEYSAENSSRMSSGKAPVHPETGTPMELHHINGRNILDPHNINNLQEVWPWEHTDIDPFRYYNGPRP